MAMALNFSIAIDEGASFLLNCIGYVVKINAKLCIWILRLMFQNLVN